MFVGKAFQGEMMHLGKLRGSTLCIASGMDTPWHKKRHVVYIKFNPQGSKRMAESVVEWEHPDAEDVLHGLAWLRDTIKDDGEGRQTSYL